MVGRIVTKEKEMQNKQTWALEDHLCKACGGRILRCVTGNGITGGGNPVFKCADCGKAAAAMGPEVLCWCGFSNRGNRDNAYTCQPFSVLKERPELLSAFRACGCDPERGEVGIMLKRDLRSNV
jgi:hypothetical protein